MKLKYFLYGAVFLTLTLCKSCGNKGETADKTADKTENPTSAKKEAIPDFIIKPESEKQLNITILWDLSDRIDPNTHPATPQHYERDLAIITSFAKSFQYDMKAKGANFAEGKIKVLFSPIPNDPKIQEYAKMLDVNLQGMSKEQIRDIYYGIVDQFQENAQKICEAALDKKEWPGSDIWRFFKNDVKDLCISNNENYKNILVILTDGYIYHSDSKDANGNKYAYILPELFTKYNLRGNPDWENVMEVKDFGLIAKSKDLQNLEILVLEVTPSESNKNDEDIIKKVLANWFDDMGVEKYKILNTGLTTSTYQKINAFFE